jgi:hypothetical protein
MAQIALLPVAPILLLPFILLFFILVFPLWLVGVAVLGILLGLSRGLEFLLRAVGVGGEKPLSGPIGNAFHWTLSWGGLAQRRDRPREE